MWSNISVHSESAVIFTTTASMAAAGSFVAEQHRHQQQIARQVHAVGDRRVDMLRRMAPQVTEGVIDKEDRQQRRVCHCSRNTPASARRFSGRTSESKSSRIDKCSRLLVRVDMQKSR